MYDPMIVDTFVRLQPALIPEAVDDGHQPPAGLLALGPSRNESHVFQTSKDHGDEIPIFRVYQLLAESTVRSWHDTVELVLHRLRDVIPFQA